jgi:hypothetical protein
MLAATNDGEVVIHERSPIVGWAQTAVLPRPAEATDQFGWSVSVEPGMVVVGDPEVDSWQGAAFVYVNTDDGWDHTRTLRPDDDGPAIFGFDVVVEDGYASVLAPEDITGTTDTGKGVVYVHDVTGSDRGREAKLHGPHGVSDDVGMANGTVVLEGGIERPLVFAQASEGDWQQVEGVPEPAKCATQLKGLAVGAEGFAISWRCVQSVPVAPDLAFYRRTEDGSWRIEDREEHDFTSRLTLKGDRLLRGATEGSASLFERGADGDWELRQVWTLGEGQLMDFGEHVALTDERALISSPGVNRTYSYAAAPSLAADSGIP